MTQRQKEMRQRQRNMGAEEASRRGRKTDRERRMRHSVGKRAQAGEEGSRRNTETGKTKRQVRRWKEIG